MSSEVIFDIAASVILGVAIAIAATWKPGGTWKTHGDATICPSCGTQGSRSETRGSIFIEIILWLCFIIPGLIYSLWRLTTRHKVCRACGSSVIPLFSPRGQQMLREAERRAA